MTDYFELLAEGRRFWIEPGALKAKFYEKSFAVHPDRVHHLGAAERAAAQERYIALNAAYQCLRDPKSRLRHLIDLEGGGRARETQTIPDSLVELFGRLGAQLKVADRILARKSGSTSPLLQVQWFQESQEQIGVLDRLRKEISGQREDLIARLKQLDTTESGTAVPPAERLDEAARMHQILSFYDRWQAQIEDRVTRLSF